jgi:hypothetical protein
MEKSSGGLKLLDVLLVVFIILKLLKVITWSWWLVLIPLWIQLALAVIGIIVIVILEKE